MRIGVNVAIEQGETFPHTPDEAAALVLAALGGDTAKDYCTLTVTAPIEPGEAGVPPEPVIA